MDAQRVNYFGLLSRRTMRTALTRRSPPSTARAKPEHLLRRPGESHCRSRSMATSHCSVTSPQIALGSIEPGRAGILPIALGQEGLVHDSIDDLMHSDWHLGLQ
jgi:hypothetical protein